MQNITTEEQTIDDLVKQRKWLTELELKSTSSWATVGPAENKHKGPA